MRSPEFSSSKLTRNPGGEIKDESDKKRFYGMLELFHKAPAPPVLNVTEMNAVIQVMEEEGRVSDECGLH
jgi:hypothetical protein